MFDAPVPAVEVDSVPGDGYLLDVREHDEWQAGHAPGAVHIPLHELAQRAGEVPSEHPVYVVCRSGGRSAQAVQALNDAGWRAANVTGGMQAWALVGREMTSENGADPQVV